MHVVKIQFEPKILRIPLFYMEICGPIILWSKGVRLSHLKRSKLFKDWRLSHKKLSCVRSLNQLSIILTPIDNNEKEQIKVKIYDFQLYFYESFVHDLLHFLFTSVRGIDLVKNFKQFIQFYHLEFSKMIILVKCPCEDYTFEKWVVKLFNFRNMNFSSFIVSNHRIIFQDVEWDSN